MEHLPAASADLDMQSSSIEAEQSPDAPVSLAGLAIVRADLKDFSDGELDFFTGEALLVSQTGSRPWYLLEPANSSDWRGVLDEFKGMPYVVHQLTLQLLDASDIKTTRNAIRSTPGLQADDCSIIALSGGQLSVVMNRGYLTVADAARLIARTEQLLADNDASAV